MRKQIPNILSVSRILISILLFFCFGKFYLFLFFYILAGLTDVLDGYLAKKLNAKTSLGAKLDSIGDLFFYTMLITYLLTQQREIVLSFLGYIILVILLRVINLVFGLIKYRRLIMVHTFANKVAGFLVFLLPILIYIERKEFLVVVLVVTLFSPIDEFLVILQSEKNEIDLNRIASVQHSV